MSSINIKEVKQLVCDRYKFRMELHAHSRPISPCSEVLPEELVKIYHDKNFDGVVLTNHFIYELMQHTSKNKAIDDYIKSFEQAKEAGEKYGIKVFFGAEIRFTENVNDYLIYGVNRDILSVCYDYLTKGVEVFRKEVKLQNSLFIQAHPFRNGCTACDPELLDGVESFNMHPGHNSRVGLAVRYSGENKLCITAGSDFHHVNQGHEAVSALRTSIIPSDSFELATLLKNGDYALEIGETSIVLP